MERFVHEQNVIHFYRMLETTTDAAERHRILELLAEEERKFTQAKEPKVK